MLNTGCQQFTFFGIILEIFVLNHLKPKTWEQKNYYSDYWGLDF